MDDPSLNSRAARDAMIRCRSELLKIPPRSPDLNPKENIFTLFPGSWRKHRRPKLSVREYQDLYGKTRPEKIILREISQSKA